jgi:tetratricopeptide (TPR) repeat protein
VQYMRYANRSDKAWDYGFFVTRYIEPGFLEHNWYPGDKAIQVATADGVPIGAVLERKEGYDLRGFEALQAHNLALADTLYTLEIAKYPHNEAARLNLADMYLQLNKLPEAKKQLDEILAAAPSHSIALTKLGVLYLQQNNAAKAEETFLQILKIDQRELNAAYYLAVIYAQKGQLEDAAAYVDMVAANAPEFAAAHDLQLKIHQKLGH